MLSALQSKGIGADLLQAEDDYRGRLYWKHCPRDAAQAPKVSDEVRKFPEGRLKKRNDVTIQKPEDAWESGVSLNDLTRKGD